MSASRRQQGRHSPPPDQDPRLGWIALNALPVNIAVVDPSGTIVAVNESWRSFAADNGVDPATVSEGASYLGVCEHLDGELAELGREFAAGLRSVLDGSCPRFSLEYPCHSPNEKRWCVGTAAPLQLDRQRFAVVAHEDITARKRAEMALRESEAQYRALVERSPSGVLAIQDGRYVFANPAAERMLGYASGELLERPALDVVHPDWHPVVIERLARLGEGAANTAVELMGIRKDGVPLLAESRSVPLTLNGRPAALILFEDIGERRRMEEAVRRNEAELSSIYDHAPVMICLLDDDTTILRANNAMAEFTGCPPQEMVGRRGGDVLGCLHALDDPNGCGRGPACPRCPLRLGVKAVLQSGQPLLRAEVTPTLIRGGVNTSVTLLVSAARIEIGADRRILLCLEEITSLKQHEATLRRQAALLDITQDAIMVQDLAGRILYWNRAAEAVYGWSAEQAIGRGADALCLSPPESQRAAIWSALTTGDRWEGELELPDRAGRSRTLFSRWTLVRDAGGQPQALLIFGNDITEQKRLQAQSMRTQRLESLGALSSGIAHDLNNVLTPILMGLEGLKDLVRSEESRLLLETMEASAQRGAETIRQLLAFARGAEGRRGVVQPRPFLAELARLVRQTFPKNIQVYSDCCPVPWVVFGDPAQLHQVLMNLCLNARDAMPKGGVLSLIVGNLMLDETAAIRHPKARPGAYVVFRVTDSGTGIPSGNLDRIFEPFFTTKPPGKGTGLGLATVLGVVEAHGGFVLVESAVGAGSTFAIHIPAAVEPVPVGPAETPTPGQAGRGEWVLVVDDEGPICGVAHNILTLHGYHPLTATTCQEALRIWRVHRERIAVVVTDLMMPFQDGFFLMRALRAEDPDVRLVATSGLATSDHLEQARHLGAHSVLSKPFTAEELLTALRETLHDRRAAADPPAD